MSTSNQSFVRSECFSFILRGYKVVLGSPEVLPGDLRIIGNLKRKFLQVVKYDDKLQTTPIGGRWSSTPRVGTLTEDQAERVKMALMTLDVAEWFIFVSADLVFDVRAKSKKSHTRPVLGKAKSIATHASQIVESLISDARSFAM